MKFRSALLAATVMAAPVAAQAQPVNGLYIGAGVGANWLMDTDLRSIDLGNVQQNNFGLGKKSQGFDVGIRTNASVGYGFGNGLRVEVEGSYRQNKLTRLGPDPFTIGGQNRAGGDEQKYGAMVNVLY